MTSLEKLMREGKEGSPQKKKKQTVQLWARAEDERNTADEIWNLSCLGISWMLYYTSSFCSPSQETAVLFWRDKFPKTFGATGGR